MKPQIFYQKIKAKGFQRDTNGLWVNPNFPVAFKPVASFVKIYHKRKGYDGNTLYVADSSSQLKSMDFVDSTLNGSQSTSNTDAKSGIQYSSAAAFLEANPTITTAADDGVYKEAPYIFKPAPDPNLPKYVEPGDGNGSGNGGVWGGGGSSPGSGTVTDEKTFFQKYKWFIIAGGVLLLLLIFKKKNK